MHPGRVWPSHCVATQSTKFPAEDARPVGSIARCDCSYGGKHQALERSEEAASRLGGRDARDSPALSLGTTARLSASTQFIVPSAHAPVPLRWIQDWQARADTGKADSAVRWSDGSNAVDRRR